MKKVIVLIVIIACAIPVWAANDGIYMSSRALSMGSALTAEADSADCAYFNPASVPYFTGYELSAGYGLLHSGLIENSLNSLFMAVSATPSEGRYGGIGIYFVNFGNDFYSERKIGLSYGYKIIDMLSLGITAKLDSLSVGVPAGNNAVNDPVVSGGVSESGFNLNGGLNLVLNEHLRFGVKVCNIIPLNSDISLPDSAFAVIGGVSVKFSKFIFLEYSRFNFDAKVQDGVVYPRFGLEGSILGGLLSIRAGYQYGSNFSFGAGIRIAAGNIKRITVNYTLCDMYLIPTISHVFGVSIWF